MFTEQDFLRVQLDESDFSRLSCATFCNLRFVVKPAGFFEDE